MWCTRGLNPDGYIKFGCASVAHGFIVDVLRKGHHAFAGLGSEYALYSYKPKLLERWNTIYSMWSHYSFLFGDFTFLVQTPFRVTARYYRYQFHPGRDIIVEVILLWCTRGLNPDGYIKFGCAIVAHGFIVDVLSKGWGIKPSQVWGLNTICTLINPSY